MLKAQNQGAARLLSELAKHVGGELIGPDAQVIGLCALSEPAPGCLSFARGTRFLKSREDLLSQPPAGLLITPEVAKATQRAWSDCPFGLVIVSDPLVAMLQIVPLFHTPDKPIRSISPKADVDTSAELGKNVHIGAFSSIGPEVVIEDDVYIHPNVTIYRGAKIGRGSTLHSGSIIREHCIVGFDTIIHNGAVVGADGFGYIPDPEVGLRKVPQIGIAVISDGVEVGANTCIDRATFGSTHIGQGSKIDNLVQVGHNVKIGKHCILCGMTGVAGSVTIGNQVVIGAASRIGDHVHITDGVRLGGGTEVRSSITEKGDFAGAPAIPVKSWKRQTVLLKRLPELFTTGRRTQKK